MLQLFELKCGGEQRIDIEVLMELKKIRDQASKMKIQDADLYIGRQRDWGRYEFNNWNALVPDVVQ